MKDLEFGENEQTVSYGGIQISENSSIHSVLKSADSSDEQSLEGIMAEMLTNFDRKPILMKISNYELSPDVINIAKEYEKQFQERNRFLWKFMGAVFQNTGATLSTVDDKYKDSTTDIKIVFTILCAIFDDVADVYNDKDLILKLKNVILQPNDSPTKEKDKKIELVKTLWKYVQDEMKKLPRYGDFIDILMYDLKQMLNGFDYSCLVKEQPYLSNMIETENYDCHNMMVFIFNGVDLMASPEFNKEDLPHMRTAFWYAQKMARIGNWLSTWKREIDEKDFGSGVFSYAFSKKIIGVNEINSLTKEEIVTRIENSDLYNYFAKDWYKNHEKLNSLKKDIKSIDMDRYVKGLEDVIQYHLATDGLK